MKIIIIIKKEKEDDKISSLFIFEYRRKKNEIIIIIIMCVCISSVKVAFFVFISLCTDSLFFTSYVRVTKKKENSRIYKCLFVWKRNIEHISNRKRKKEKEKYISDIII